jgi:hypothetical protein
LKSNNSYKFVNVYENNTPEWEDEFQEIEMKIVKNEEEKLQKNIHKFNSGELIQKNYLSVNSDKSKTNEDIEKFMSIKSITNSEKIR